MSFLFTACSPLHCHHPPRRRGRHLVARQCADARMLSAVFSRHALLSRAAPRVARRTMASANELELLEKLLQEARRRSSAEKEAAAAAAAAAAPTGPLFQVKTFNAISPVGLQVFMDEGHFTMTGSSGEPPAGQEDEPHAILLRSHKLKSEEVAPTVRAIARCGAGTNNIPIKDMTERGVPVFNTPGANANGVKELVLCSLFLASRGVVEGINHTTDVICKEASDHETRNARVEKDKSKFAGQELRGRTLAVLGLGNIGAMVAEAALALDMKVVGYDPKISVDAAWRLSSQVTKMDSMEDAFEAADYVSVNMPYIKGVTHHIISDDVLSHMKPTAHLVNFARGELVDGAALERLYKKGHVGKYISDFPDPHLQDHPKFTCIPHLGASTGEAEDNCARMAADQVLDFLETGTIINSVNFPNTHLDMQSAGQTRICIINKNEPGVLGQITTVLGSLGFNIAQQLNTSREAIAYNVVDVEGLGTEDIAKLKNIMAIPGVISTRVIWTGSAAEGPKDFHVNA